jgi:hypothetical protein
MIKADRPQTPLHALLDLRHRPKDLDRPDALSAQQLDADAGVFERKLAQASKEDDDAPSDDDRPARPSPFELFPKLPANTMSENVPVAYPAVADIVRDIVHEVYVSNDNIADRRVSMRLADHVLPGVMLSIHEDEGRVNVDFVCSAAPSRTCLCQIAPRLCDELANQLHRETRVSVRSDDPEDLDPFYTDGTPAQARQEGPEAGLRAMGNVRDDR